MFVLSCLVFSQWLFYIALDAQEEYRFNLYSAHQF